MTTESIIELQKLDCNCNDCRYLARNIARFNTVLAEDQDNQYYFFRQLKARRIRAARKKVLKDRERGLIALAAAVALEFHYFAQSTKINYGGCTKFDKPVSFIPGILQLETQQCFVHRRN